jgi:hypothetical protein
METFDMLPPVQNFHQSQLSGQLDEWNEGIIQLVSGESEIYLSGGTSWWL